MRLLSVVATAVLAFAALAFADSKTKTDPKGDAPKRTPDLRSASVKHDGRDVIHRVTAWNSMQARGGPALELDTESGRPDYFVAFFESKPGVYAYTRTGSRRVASAKYVKHSAKSFSYRFNLRFANGPAKYRWRWAFRSPEEPRGDRLPNRGLVTHKLDQLARD